MNEQYKSKLAKIVGDVCGLLVCVSIGSAIFMIMLSISILYYRVEVLPAVSIMIGVTLACSFARLTLFMSYCQGSKPADVFNPLVIYLGGLSMLGMIGGLFVSTSYNGSFPHEMCYQVVIGLDDGFAEEIILQCHEIQRDVYKITNSVFAAYSLSIIVWAIARIMYGVSRLDRSEPVDNG